VGFSPLKGKLGYLTAFFLSGVAHTPIETEPASLLTFYIPCFQETITSSQNKSIGFSNFY
jgi:hypothetical protein